MAPKPSASVFALPLPPWLQPASSRTAQYDRKRKNAGSEDELDDDTTDVATDTETEAGPSLVLTPNESHQYRIAGQPLHQELSRGHFPHEPPKDAGVKRESTASQLKALADLSPPIYPPQSAQEGNIRFQHLGVLTAIVHRCMLQGDYVRAGRAWGLVLRENYRGIPMDVRNEDRWGIGAEILLRRDQQEPSTGFDASSTPSAFTPKGFAEAKEYYERLILNHPFMKSSPESVSSLNFYPAMFGLWVYVTQEQSNIARKDVAAGQEEESDAFSDEGSESDLEQRRTQRERDAISAIRARELEQAQQIATRMDQLLPSPPYSDSPELLELRGMISLWIGDLLVSALTLPVGFDEDPDDDTMLIDNVPGALAARREHRFATDKKAVEVQKSAELFEKAKKRGRGVTYNLENFHIDDGTHNQDEEK